MAEPTDPKPADEPVVVEPVAAGDHVGVDPVVPEVDDDEVIDDVAAPVVVEPVAEPVAEYDAVAPVPVVAAPVVSEADAAAAREVVYVQAPTPPPARHNRGFGVLISLLGAVAFALLYIAVIAILVAIAGASVDATLSSFLQSMAFWVPVAVYAVVSSLFALIVNRAAWWAHALGSLFVAVITYAVSGGIVALALNVIGMTPEEGVATLGSVFSSPQLIVALVLAREVSLWFGLAIAARGRRVKERNVAERAAFDQSVADRRAEYERAHPSA
jgi:hypothetical protein